MTRKNFKPAITAYVLECLAEEDHGLDNPTNDQIWGHVKSRIELEYDHMIKRAGPQNAIREWLLGLAINCDFTYFDIEQRLKSWGLLAGNESETKLYKELNLYWDRLAAVIAQNIRKVKVA
jgi:hypothetical protein